MNLVNSPTSTPRLRQSGSNRRRETRMPLQMFLNEYVDDRPQRCMALNVSPGGLYLNRLNMPGARFEPTLAYPPPDKLVGLEFELPETSEVIWASSRVCFDDADPYFHGTGVRFAGIADYHRRLIRDYVLDFREKTLRDLLARVRRNKRVFLRPPRPR